MRRLVLAQGIEDSAIVRAIIDDDAEVVAVYGNPGSTSSEEEPPSGRSMTKGEFFTRYEILLEQYEKEESEE